MNEAYISKLMGPLMGHFSFNMDQDLKDTLLKCLFTMHHCYSASADTFLGDLQQRLKKNTARFKEDSVNLITLNSKKTTLFDSSNKLGYNYYDCL
jgi:hypothetical protein